MTTPGTPLGFRVEAHDTHSRARRGLLTTRRGPVETPVFMPVGTRATVTGMSPDELTTLDAKILLANTYHLMLRPGPELFRRVGGIHELMRWPGLVLTDSGGYQIFSLPADRTISEEGARFKSYVDCRFHMLSPEKSIAMQSAIGSDIMMVLDHCIDSTADADAMRAALTRTHRWALRSLAARENPEQAIFAITQGGLDLELRRESAAFLGAHAFDGFAIGGLAVGDTRAQREDIIAQIAETLPADRPRYLMGVGTPPDILHAIGCGVDMFDCVIPTHLAWQGTAFTSTGRVRITRGANRLAEEPLDATCPCATCKTHSRAYLHHLMKCSEPLGPRLMSFHNLDYYLQLMREARAAIDRGEYAAFARSLLAEIDRHEHAAARAGMTHERWCARAPAWSPCRRPARGRRGHAPRRRPARRGRAALCSPVAARRAAGRARNGRPGAL